MSSLTESWGMGVVGDGTTRNGLLLCRLLPRSRFFLIRFFFFASGAKRVVVVGG